eukprot:COSAG01_NODE_1262_length_10999_cov_12.033853_10_plen_95_part_00
MRLRRAPHRAKTTVGLLTTGIPVFRQVRGRLHSCACDIARTRCHPLTGGVAGAFTATEQLKRPIIQYRCARPALCLARADADTLMCRLELPHTD